MYFVFRPHLTCASALPGETGNPKIAPFHLNVDTIKHTTDDNIQRTGALCAQHSPTTAALSINTAFK